VQLVLAVPNIAQVGARLSQVPDCVIGRRRFGPVACDGCWKEAKLTTLKLLVGPGDQGEPVITIRLPDEA